MIDVEKARQRILDLAIRGKLVPQDPNDEPASVLLERIREEQIKLHREGKIKKLPEFSYIYRGSDNRYYEKKGQIESDITKELPFILPRGWAWARLSSLVQSIAYGLGYSAQKSGSNKYLRITDIQDGAVKWVNVPYVTIKENEVDSILQRKDIVFARTGATVGKSYLVDDCPAGTVFASYLIRVRFLETQIANYVYVYFNSDTYWKSIIDQSVGTGQPNCNGSRLGNLLIPLPPMSEQIRILKKVGDTMPIIQTIREKQASIISLTRTLRAKVLSAIFSSDKSYYEIASAGKLISGRDLNSAQYGDKGKTPYLTGASNFVRGTVQTNRYTDNPQVLSYEGDVLITCKGTIGKTAITPFRECHIARQIMAFRCNKTMINEYCKYLLLAKASDLQWASSSLIPGFDRNDFLGLKYPHKTLGEQQKVCLMLNKLFSTIGSICADI